MGDGEGLRPQFLGLLQKPYVVDNVPLLAIGSKKINSFSTYITFTSGSSEC